LAPCELPVGQPNSVTQIGASSPTASWAAWTTRSLELPLGLVQAAVAYYGAYPGEIDEWIDLNEREAAEAHAAWLAGQAALQR
jgi:hypothetical protein